MNIMNKVFKEPISRAKKQMFKLLIDDHFLSIFELCHLINNSSAVPYVCVQSVSQLLFNILLVLHENKFVLDSPLAAFHLLNCGPDQVWLTSAS